MKKLNKFTAQSLMGVIAAISVVAMLSACAKDELVNSQQETIEVIKDFNAVAKVTSQEAVSDLLDNSNGDLTRANTGASVTYEENFVSMMDTYEVKNKVPVTYYEHFEYAELVPNTKLASLLNTKGEIQVGDVMYRITGAGTYYFDPSLRTQVDSMIEEWDQAKGTQVAEWTVKLSEGVMRYNTFEKAQGEVFENTDFYADDPNWNNDAYWDELESQVGKAGNTRAAPSLATMLSYPTFEAGRTWFGNKTYEAYFSSNRRLKAKFYTNDYLFRTDIGVWGKLQKKQWIGWHKTNADQMRILYTDVLTELELPIVDPRVHIPPRMRPKYLGYYWGILPGAPGLSRIVVIADINVDGAPFKEAVNKGGEYIVKYLSKEAGFNVVPKDFPGNFLLVSGKKAYALFAWAVIDRYNVDKLDAEFIPSQFGFKVEVPDNPGNWKEWLQSISVEKSKVKLKSAKCMIDARLGSEWRGMILKKSL